MYAKVQWKCIRRSHKNGHLTKQKLALTQCNNNNNAIVYLMSRQQNAISTLGAQRKLGDCTELKG